MAKNRMKSQAEVLAKKGRYGDSMLVHMNPAEVAELARMTPGGLTINPDTGQPEAFLPFLLGLLGGGAAAALPAATLAATAAPAAAAAAAPALAATAAPTLAATALPAAELAATATPGLAGLGALESATLPALTAAETAATAAPAAAAPQQLAAMGLGDIGGFDAAVQSGAIAAPPAPLPPPIDPSSVPTLTPPVGPQYPVPTPTSNPAVPLTPADLQPAVDPGARIPTGTSTPKMPDSLFSDAPGIGQPANLPAPIEPPVGTPPPQITLGGDLPGGITIPNEGVPLDTAAAPGGPGGPQELYSPSLETIDETIVGGPAVPTPSPSTPPPGEGGDFSLSSITSSPFLLPGLLAASSLASSTGGDDGSDSDEDNTDRSEKQPSADDTYVEFPGDDYNPGVDPEFDYFPRRFANGGIISPADRVQLPDSQYRPGIDPAHIYFPENVNQPVPDAAAPGVDSALQALADQNAASISRIDKQLSYEPKGGAGGGGGSGDDGGASALADGGPVGRYAGGGIVDAVAQGAVGGLAPMAVNAVMGDSSPFPGGSFFGKKDEDDEEDRGYAEGGTVSIPFSFDNASVSGGDAAGMNGPSMGANTSYNSMQSSYSLPDALTPPAFANGGPVPAAGTTGPLSNQDPRITLMVEAEKALTGEHPNPRKVLDQFVRTFGEGALKQLEAGVMARMQQSDAGRLIEGPGGPRSDDVPARINGVEEAALSDGEFVVTANAVKNIGGGDSRRGAQALTQLNQSMGGRGAPGGINVERVR